MLQRAINVQHAFENCLEMAYAFEQAASTMRKSRKRDAQNAFADEWRNYAIGWASR